jgi:hypothetical protein
MKGTHFVFNNCADGATRIRERRVFVSGQGFSIMNRIEVFFSGGTNPRGTKFPILQRAHSGVSES